MLKQLTKHPEQPAAPARLTETQAASAIRAKEVELAAEELELAHQFKVEQLEAERAAWRAEQAAKAKAVQMDQARSRWSTRLVQWRSTWSKFVATAVPFLPLVLVNAMAVMGQFGWGLEHLDQFGNSPADWARRIVAAMFAGALESLSLFQGYYASKALERRDSAAGLYAGAFATAAVVAALNYSHYADDKNPVGSIGSWDVPGVTATAVVFALFSFISPALWRIHSRAVNRDKLKAAGEIDTRAPRLSWSKKLWHPIRTVRAMYWATWEKGVETPADVLDLYEAKMAERRAAKAQGKGQKPEKAKDDEKAEEKPKRKPQGRHRGQEKAERPDPNEGGGQKTEDSNVRPLIAQRFPEAWEAYVDSVRGGNALSQRALAAEHLNNNRHHARDIIDAWKEVSGNGNDTVRAASA